MENHSKKSLQYNTVAFQNWLRVPPPQAFVWTFNLSLSLWEKAFCSSVTGFIALLLCSEILYRSSAFWASLAHLQFLSRKHEGQTGRWWPFPHYQMHTCVTVCTFSCSPMPVLHVSVYYTYPKMMIFDISKFFQLWPHKALSLDQIH